TDRDMHPKEDMTSRAGVSPAQRARRRESFVGLCLFSVVGTARWATAVELSDGRATVSSPRRWDWCTNPLKRRAEDSRPYLNSMAVARRAVRTASSGATWGATRTLNRYVGFAEVGRRDACPAFRPYAPLAWLRLVVCLILAAAIWPCALSG